jgi:nitroreductase
MNVFQAIQTRHSIRKFQDKPVEDDKLQQILEAARLAPSARNMQEWKFIVVRDPAQRRKLAEAANGQVFIGRAAAVIVGCATITDYVMSCGHPAYLVDLAIAMDHMSLAAVELGLGGCWIGAFDQKAVKKLLGIPDPIAVVQLMPLGYPAEPAEPRPRKALSEIVLHERWR